MQVSSVFGPGVFGSEVFGPEVFWAVALSGGLGVWLAVIAVIDARTLRIPDGLSLPLIGAGLVAAAFWPASELADRLIGAGAGFLILGAVGEVYFRLRQREGLGLGDAKLFAGAGAWLGWQMLPWVLVVASVAALCRALIHRSRPEIAFGPWLALGFWLCLQVRLFWPG